MAAKVGKVYIGFLSNTCPDPKLPSQHSMLLGHHQLASETSMMVGFYWYLDPLSPYQLKNGKNVVVGSNPTRGVVLSLSKALLIFVSIPWMYQQRMLW